MSSAVRTMSGAGLPSSASLSLVAAVIASSASSAERRAASSSVRGRRREHDAEPAVGAGAEQLGRAGQRREPAPVLLVEGQVRGVDRVVLVLVAVVAEEAVEQLVAGHADGVVHVGHRDVVAVLAQRLGPAHGVQVGGVDQRAVDVEQDAASHVSPVPAPGGRQTRTRLGLARSRRCRSAAPGRARSACTIRSTMPPTPVRMRVPCSSAQRRCAATMAPSTLESMNVDAAGVEPQHAAAGVEMAVELGLQLGALATSSSPRSAMAARQSSSDTVTSTRRDASDPVANTTVDLSCHVRLPNMTAITFEAMRRLRPSCTDDTPSRRPRTSAGIGPRPGRGTISLRARTPRRRSTPACSTSTACSPTPPRSTARRGRATFDPVLNGARPAAVHRGRLRRLRRRQAAPRRRARLPAPRAASTCPRAATTTRRTPRRVHGDRRPQERRRAAPDQARRRAGLRRARGATSRPPRRPGCAASSSRPAPTPTDVLRGDRAGRASSRTASTASRSTSSGMAGKPAPDSFLAGAAAGRRRRRRRRRCSRTRPPASRPAGAAASASSSASTGSTTQHARGAARARRRRRRRRPRRSAVRAPTAIDGEPVPGRAVGAARDRSRPRRRWPSPSRCSRCRTGTSACAATSTRATRTACPARTSTRSTRPGRCPTPRPATATRSRARRSSTSPTAS